jgi:hypothetical protein
MKGQLQTSQRNLVPLMALVVILALGQPIVFASTYSSQNNINIQQTSGDCSSSSSPLTELTFNSTVTTTTSSPNNNYSIQMNASPGANSWGAYWLQYIIAVEPNGDIEAIIQYFSPQGLLENDMTTSPIYQVSNIQSGDAFIIQPLTNNNGLVTGATMEWYSHQMGAWAGHTFNTGHYIALLQWQTDIIGNGNGAYVNFNSGGGTLDYQNNGGSVTYETGQANTLNGGCAPVQSGETSNMEYSSPTTSNGQVYQNFNPADVTVRTIDQNGLVIPGYTVVLYNSAGTQINSGYSQASFNGLSNGQLYYVEPESYGSCSFNHWQDTGSTVADRSFFASNGSPPLYVAVYQCGSGGGSSNINVVSENQNGGTITGYFTSLTGPGSSASGYTPVNFQGLTPGDQYTITVDNYGGCSFTNWFDGNTNDPRAFAATGQTVTAIYNCGGYSEPYITVQSEDLNGNTLTGYYIQLYYSGSGGSLDATGYTSVTFQGSPVLTDGDGYIVYANSYGPCNFDYWLNNGEAGGYQLTVYGTTALTLTAVYNCG